jgi:molybdate transport system substrate-binding protein
VKVVAEFPEDPAHPIRYVGIAVSGARPEAQALLEYLTGPEAQAAFARHGFTPLFK